MMIPNCSKILLHINSYWNSAPSSLSNVIFNIVTTCLPDDQVSNIFHLKKKKIRSMKTISDIPFTTFYVQKKKKFFFNKFDFKTIKLKYLNCLIKLRLIKNQKYIRLFPKINVYHIIL